MYFYASMCIIKYPFPLYVLHLMSNDIYNAHQSTLYIYIVNVKNLEKIKVWQIKL